MKKIFMKIIQWFILLISLYISLWWAIWIYENIEFSHIWKSFSEINREDYLIYSDIPWVAPIQKGMPIDYNRIVLENKWRKYNGSCETYKYYKWIYYNRLEISFNKGFNIDNLPTVETLSKLLNAIDNFNYEFLEQPIKFSEEYTYLDWRKKQTVTFFIEINESRDKIDSIIKKLKDKNNLIELNNVNSLYFKVKQTEIENPYNKYKDFFKPLPCIHW